MHCVETCDKRFKKVTDPKVAETSNNQMQYNVIISSFNDAVWLILHRPRLFSSVLQALNIFLLSKYGTVPLTIVKHLEFLNSKYIKSGNLGLN